MSGAIRALAVKWGEDPALGGGMGKLAGLGRVCEWGRGQTILREDEEIEEVHLILFGKVLRVSGARADIQPVFDLHAHGEILGLVGLLDGGPTAHAYVAHTRVVTRCIPISEVMSAVERDPASGRALFAQIARWQRHDSARTVALATDRVETRFRALLADLADRFGVQGDSRGLLVDLGLTRAQLAGMSGTAVETIIRTINALRDRELLIPDGRRFFIPDLDALRP